MRPQVIGWLVGCVLLAPAGGIALGNGGPFLVTYPGGDPAAKGVPARIDVSMKPTRETQLRVVKEGLSIRFKFDEFNHDAPLTAVAAQYTIENPTDKPVQIAFGFPILRGLHISHPMAGYYPIVDVWVHGAKKGEGELRDVLSSEWKGSLGHRIPFTVVTNSVIYGVIRHQARAAIEAGISKDATLDALVKAVRSARHAGAKAPAGQLAKVRSELFDLLTKQRGWNDRDAALMTEYADMEFKEPASAPHDRWFHTENASKSDRDKTAEQIAAGHLGRLSLIGERKATQFLAHLAGRFDKKAASNYEAIFAAWGGDVRERAVDMQSGELRPREFTLPPGDKSKPRIVSEEATVYARVDYLDSDVKLTNAENESLRIVLKNLPVTFTFAPMNLLAYQIHFPARSTRVVTVWYEQFAFTDTKGQPSYQLAYVLHPATLWDSFGPIHVRVEAPKGALCRASFPFARTTEVPRHPESHEREAGIEAHNIYEFVLTKPQEKSGELMIGLDKAAWDEISTRYEKVRRKYYKPERDPGK